MCARFGGAGNGLQLTWSEARDPSSRWRSSRQLAGLARIHVPVGMRVRFELTSSGNNADEQHHKQGSKFHRMPSMGLRRHAAPARACRGGGSSPGVSVAAANAIAELGRSLAKSKVESQRGLGKSDSAIEGVRVGAAGRRRQFDTATSCSSCRLDRAIDEALSNALAPCLLAHHQCRDSRRWGLEMKHRCPMQGYKTQRNRAPQSEIDRIAAGRCQLAETRRSVIGRYLITKFAEQGADRRPVLRRRGPNDKTGSA